MAERVRDYLGFLPVALAPHKTGAAHINFLELDGATEERVRASYSPEDQQRLVGLKDRHDPDNLFRFNRNIPPSFSES